MRNILLVAASALVACGAAWAADVAADGGYSASPNFSAPTPHDQATLELKWDNGTRRWSVAWYTGGDSWVGNDFGTSTLKTTHVKILKFKRYSYSDWPNTGWDGFRIGFFNFRGGVPGDMLWPTGGTGYYFRPSGLSGHVWVECDINWTCPTVAFVAAEEQFYNWPTCDPFALDNNTTFLKHSWQYYGGSWSPVEFPEEWGPYRNLMIRVWVETGQEFPGVAPSSIGRVKALYY
jgi:hypothetical protein